MALLNYSTTIAVEKSIMEIQKILVTHGASKILSDYDRNGNITSLSFEVTSPYGPLHIKLPANKEPILQILRRQKAAGKIRKQIDGDQALRVAWRIIKDWVEAQMALLETDMVKMEEIFMPYVLLPGGQTFFQKFENDRKLLNSGEAEPF